jgi:hypothetical protein
MNNDYDRATKTKLKLALRNTGWRDPSDEYVYNVAKAIFYKRCEEYGISTKFGEVSDRVDKIVPTFSSLLLL